MISSNARMLMLASLLLEGEALTTEFIRKGFKVSPATAKRDLAMIRKLLPVKVNGNSVYMRKCL